MPYLTGFFLVFAGMLIGYFLWYWDRTDEERAHLDLEREADDLRRGLKLTQQSKVELEERLVRQRGQLSVLQQLCEDWSVSREQSERERAMLVVEVEDKRRKQDEANSELQRLKTLQIDLEDRLHQQTRQHLETASHNEQAWQKKFLTQELSLNQRLSELQQAERETKRLADNLRKAETQNAELKTEITTHQNLLETATKNVSGLKQEYVSLETSLKEHHDQLKRSRGETAAALSEKKQAQQSLAEMQAQYQRLHLEADELRQKLGDLDAMQQESNTLRQALENGHSQIQTLSLQRDQALQSEKGTLAMAAGLQTRLNNQESTIHKLREAHREVMEKLKYELQLRTDLEATYEDQCKSLETRFQQQQKQLESQSSESQSKLAAQVEQLRRQIAQQSSESKNLLSKNENLTQELNQTKSTLTKLKADLQTINHEAAKLKAETMRLANLEKSLAEHDSKLKREIELTQTATHAADALRREMQQRDQQLAAETQQRQSAEKHIADLESELTHRALRISELEVKLDHSARELETAAQGIEDLKQAVASPLVAVSPPEVRDQDTMLVQSLETRLKASEETIRQLRKERSAVMARLANYRSQGEVEATILPFNRALEVQRRSAYDNEYGGTFRQDPVRGMVYTAEPTQCDDLKLISGIAEVLEAKLNDLGVYTFKQICDWTPEAVAEFGRLFHFKDRILREDWQGQARGLYEARLSQRRQAA